MKQPFTVIAFGVCLSLCVAMTACADNYATQGILHQRNLDTDRIDPGAKRATTVVPMSTATPTPKPTPTPIPSSSNFDVDRVAELYRLPDAFAKKALAEINKVHPNSVVMRMLERAYAWPIWALPDIYMMHMFATGGPESGHPLVDVDQFVTAYFGDVRHFARVANTWLNDYLADPCSVSEFAREWVIAVEEAAPGTLAASIGAAAWAGPDSLLKQYIDAAYETAASALYDNPNRYRCTRP